MGRKEVILDFTPLLDVTLILLFFFLLFSTFEMADAKTRLDTQMEAAEDRMAQANAKYEKADALVEQLKEDLAMVEQAGDRQASNLEALMEFNHGANIKLILSADQGAAGLKVFRGDELIATTSADGDLAGLICAALREAGYTQEDTVLCEFILDGSEAGSNAAYRKIKQNLLTVKETYPYFYYSETDISMGDD